MGHLGVPSIFHSEQAFNYFANLLQAYVIN